jgi:hypothetical protein
MKPKLMIGLSIGLVFFLTLVMSARQTLRPIELHPITSPRDFPVAVEDQAANPVAGTGPVHILGVIPIPGGLAGVDIGWPDQDRGRVYFASMGKASVFILDAINDTFVGQITGFVGATGVDGGRGGPNGILVTPDNILWAGDGNSLVRAVDLNVNPPTITHTVSLGNAVADGRADELAYDPFEREVLVGSDVAHPPKLTFISADTFSVIGKIDFPDATGMEQPIWDTQLHRFLVNVPSTPSYIAVIDPRKMQVTKKYTYACNAGVNGLTLGPNQRMLVSGCGNAFVMNAINGHIITPILQVAGGDEVWYNIGDNRYYVIGADRTAGLGTSLGVIDAATNTWIQNVPAVGPRTLTAFAGNNHIYGFANAPANPAADTTVCARFGLVGTGCVVVFSHN